MEVIEAIESRRSIRAFLPDPVSQETVEKILKTAIRAPSGTNTQPWYVYAVSGDARDKLVERVLVDFNAGIGEAYEDNDYYPVNWNETHKARRRKIGWDLYGLVGIKKGERDKTHIQHQRNYRFFDAPVGLFFFTDSYVCKGSWVDVGMMVQTVMLAARGHGLHTCPQACWMRYATLIRELVGAPMEQTLVCGMALGFEDTAKIENTLVTEREGLENIARFAGFECG